MSDGWFNYWTLDLIIGLPASGLFNAVMVCIDKLTKLVRLVPYLVGDGEVTTPAITCLFFVYVVLLY